MRHIDTIVLHYSATPEDKEFHVEDIRRWHKARGWSDVGYHFILTLDGKIEVGRPLDIVGAHVKNHNTGKIGVCYIGGLDKTTLKSKDTMNRQQEEAFKLLVASLCTILQKDLDIVGHKDLVPTYCPGFDVKTKFKEIIEWKF